MIDFIKSLLEALKDNTAIVILIAGACFLGYEYVSENYMVKTVAVKEHTDTSNGLKAITNRIDRNHYEQQLDKVIGDLYWVEQKADPQPADHQRLIELNNSKRKIESALKDIPAR